MFLYLMPKLTVTAKASIMKVSRSTRLAALASVAVLILAGSGTAWRMQGAPAQAQTIPALPEIEVASVRQQPIAEQRSFSGRIEAVEQVEIRPLVSGTIVGVYFRDGDLVRKDQPLFTIVRVRSRLRSIAPRAS
jgi:membrane fusion protein, multidrug efflux system